MTENKAAETEPVEIRLDPSKLLGFQTLATLGEDAADLRRRLKDTHTKIGFSENSGTLSDARLKTGVRFREETATGLRLYNFRYVGDERAFVGVMAQDLLEDDRYAHAVADTAEGYYRVDYGAIGLQYLVSAEMREAGAQALSRSAAL